jgi:hypothetical protein
MNPTRKPFSLSLVAKAQVARVWPGSPPVEPMKIERMKNLQVEVDDNKKERGSKCRFRPKP